MAALVDRKHLLSSVEVAHFVAHGSIILESVVPAALNERAIEVFDGGIPGYPYGTPLDEAFPQGTFVRELLDLPVGGRRGAEPGRPRAEDRPPRYPHPAAARWRGPEHARRRHPGYAYRRF